MEFLTHAKYQQSNHSSPSAHKRSSFIVVKSTLPKHESNADRLMRFSTHCAKHSTENSITTELHWCL